MKSKMRRIAVQKGKESMFVVEVEVVKQWTDRGDNPWVTIHVLGDKAGEMVEVDIPPEKIIQVRRSMILVEDDS
jgi:hypothetical protein